MISVQNAVFSYDDSHILKGISYVEESPIIAGLWGRNGVGKTTLMKLMAGHMKPSEGRLEIMGQQPYNNVKAQKHLCYMQEDHPFSEIWTVRDALRFYQYFNPNWNQEEAFQLLEAFELPEKKKVKKLSTGMKTALQQVIGLASHAEVTILDEPTNGLDAGMRKTFYKLLLKSYETNPRLIVVSTHHIEEIQNLLDSIMVIHDGKLVMHKSMEEIREMGMWLTGEGNQVDALVKGKRVLEESKMGSMKKVMIDDAISDVWRDHARKGGVSLESAPLQDYLLNVTEKKKEGIR